MLAAGIEEAKGTYKVDLFQSNDYLKSPRSLEHLKAFLIHYSELGRWKSDESIPAYILNHLRGTKILKSDEPMDNVAKLYRKYRNEWSRLIESRRRLGVPWTGLIDENLTRCKECVMSQLNLIDPRVLGLRIAEARKARGKTQKEVADHIECSRPTYIAIEKGERQASADEITKIAKFLGRKVHELVRSGEPVTELQPHLRAVAGKMKEKDEQLLLSVSTSFSD